MIVSGNNWKDGWYILGYQVDSGSDRPTVYKDKQKILYYTAMVQLNTTRNKITQCHSMSSSLRSGYFTIKTSKRRLHHLLQKLTTEPIKRKDKYMHANLETWKKQIKTSFHNRKVWYHQYCNTTFMLESVYKQGKNCIPRVYAEDRK